MNYQKKKNKRKVCDVLGAIIFILGVVLGCYIGVWEMFIKPIIDAVSAFDAGTLTGTIIAWTILKCIFAGAIGSLIFIFGVLLARIIYCIGNN